MNSHSTKQCGLVPQDLNLLMNLRKFIFSEFTFVLKRTGLTAPNYLYDKAKSQNIAFKGTLCPI